MTGVLENPPVIEALGWVKPQTPPQSLPWDFAALSHAGYLAVSVAAIVILIVLILEE